MRFVRKILLVYKICVIRVIFFVKYADDTIAIVSFDASLRTTFYRKINEIALKVKGEDVDSVYYVSEFVSYGSVCSVEDIEKLIGMPHIERQQHVKKSALAFCQIDKNGVKSIWAEGELVNGLLSMDDVMQFKSEYDTAHYCFFGYNYPFHGNACVFFVGQ